MAKETTQRIDKKQVEALIGRFGDRFYKKDNHYAMDYGTRFNPTRDPKTNKIKYKKSPGDKISPFWFCAGQTDYRTYELHVIKIKDNTPVEKFKNEEFYERMIKEREEENQVDMGMIFPPCDLNGDSETKGMGKWGALDEDEYDKPEHLKRIVKQIYEEKLPLAPCYSKSGGLHVYIFTRKMVQGDNIVNALKHFKKILKATAKEINPKQTKPTWDKKKNRWSPGNGILVPYRSSIQQEHVPNPPGSIHVAHSEYSFIQPDNGWIKNENMEVGTLEEFLDYADTIELDQSSISFLLVDPAEEKRIEEDKKELKRIEEEKEEEDFETALDEYYAPSEPPAWSGEPPIKEEPKIKKEKRDFSESNARPLSEKSLLSKIIQNIKNKKKHSKGGTFDNHVTDFVYGAMESKLSDKHILEHLEQVADVDSENIYEGGFDGAIQKKINNCRDKYDKADPGPLRIKFMEDTIFVLKTGMYQDNSTKKQYDKESLNVKYAHIFPKKTTPTLHFKEDPNKQLAEEETYRPDLYNENELLMKGDDELYYLNSYKPGNKPIKPEKKEDMKPFLDLVEHVIPNKKEREYFLDWLAFMVQNPWRKIKTIVVIYTKAQRMGKGSINDTMTDILGESNCEPTDVRGMLDKGVTFAEKQLILIDECKSKGSYGEKANLINDLKKIGTETRIQQRRLYTDYKVITTQTNYLVFTNLSDALNIETEDQRFFVVANENPRKEQSFYKAYHKWREDKGSNYTHHWLKERDLSKFNPMEPPPMTEGKKEMGKETGHPLTLKLRQMLDEGEHPLSLNVSVLGSTELAHYIGKHHKGKHVQYANDTKQMKKSLLEIGATELGQVYHKSLDYKPSLFVIRNHGDMLKKLKSELCNEVWKPIYVGQPADEKREEDRNKKFSDNQLEHAGEFEKRFKKERSTYCWECKEEIDTDSNDLCEECNFGIKCPCGKCTCDDPKSNVKKLPQYRKKNEYKFNDNDEDKRALEKDEMSNYE